MGNKTRVRSSNRDTFILNLIGSILVALILGMGLYLFTRDSPAVQIKTMDASHQ